METNQTLNRDGNPFIKINDMHAKSHHPTDNLCLSEKNLISVLNDQPMPIQAV